MFVCVRVCACIRTCVCACVYVMSVLLTQLLCISGHDTTTTTPVTTSTVTGSQYQTGENTQASFSFDQPLRQTPAYGMHGQTSGT